MKILIVSALTENPKGGIAVWTQRYFNAAQKYAISYELVNTKVIGKREKNGTLQRNFFNEWKRTKGIFAQLSLGLKICNADKIMHLNTSCGTFGLYRDYIIAKKAKKAGFKVVTQFHCDIPYWLKNIISKKYLKKLVKLSDCCLTLCENSCRYLWDIAQKESIKIPNFLSEGIISNDRKIITNKIKKAVFVGRIEAAKGANELFALASYFPDIEFCLIGEVDANFMQREKLSNITFEGTLSADEVIKKLDTADIFIFPTHSEGFSMALAEAMARGLPIVTTDVGANKDMIENRGGIIVPVGDVDAFKTAIQEMKNPKIREEMSAWNLQKVKEYEVDNVFQRFMEIYRRLWE